MDKNTIQAGPPIPPIPPPPGGGSWIWNGAAWQPNVPPAVPAVDVIAEPATTEADEAIEPE